MILKRTSLADVDNPARRASEGLVTMEVSTINDKPKKAFKRTLVWKNIAVYVIGHVLGIYGTKILIFDISWTLCTVGFAIGFFCTFFGIQVGAHRYYAHRCYKASKLMQVLILLAQTTASQNCMWVWVRDHRQHHKFSDTDADPHNSSNGFFFAHVGWLLSKKHPDVIEKGKEINMSDLDDDPLVMFQKRHYTILWLVIAIIIPNLITFYLSGEPLIKCFMLVTMFRIVFSLNITWLVNSWAHLYGTRPFDKNIQPVESYFVSLVTSGEGWHNYHHTFPWDYKAAEAGAPFNWAALFIRLCAHLGLAWDLKEASDEMIASRAWRTGDGTPIRTKVKVSKACQ